MQKILKNLANIFVWNICSISCDSLEWTNPDHTLVTNHPDIVKSQKSLRGFRNFWARHLKAASHRICRKWRTRLCPSCSNVMSMSNCHEKDIYKYKTFCTWESEPNNSKKQVLERKKQENLRKTGKKWWRGGRVGSGGGGGKVGGGGSD